MIRIPHTFRRRSYDWHDLCAVVVLLATVTLAAVGLL